ncbi:MAG: hypothetical protein A2W85_01695 [Bacteroidetes bacterium GWF2_41_31]|nr:MAG: hypothetical protein A2W85_01695 [Bacteroidetes bacterium GWF2_41_31]
MAFKTQNPNSDLAIKVSSLSKVYPLYNTPRDRLKEALHPKRKKYHHDFYALKDLSFEIRKGDTVGIIGQNGSGKSTLLKILSNVLSPSEGSYVVNGNVSSLLELGTGFNPELTGIENVYFNGTLLGFTREEMDTKIEDILNFADIGEFVKQPVKTYSSGMFVRLAFAVAVQVDPDILIIDEALSVGDARFQVKSMNRMLKLVEGGKTVIFVSHDTGAVKSLCKRAILLEKGKIIKDADASSVVDHYSNMMLNEMHQGDDDLLVPVSVEINNELLENFEENEVPVMLGENSINTGEIDLISTGFYNSKKQRVEIITSEEDITLGFKIKVKADFADPHYGFMIKNRLGLSAFETNTYCMNINTAPLKKNDTVSVEFLMNFNLSPGLYSLTFGFANKGYGKGSFENYPFLGKDVAIINVTENQESIVYAGYYNMNPKVAIKIN